MKSLSIILKESFLLNEEEYQINKKDLKKISRVLKDSTLWEKLDKKYNLIDGLTQRYCKDRLSRFSDPEWYLNFEDDNEDITLKYVLTALFDWDGEDYISELEEEDPDIQDKCSGFNIQDMVRDVLEQCLKTLK